LAGLELLKLQEQEKPVLVFCSATFVTGIRAGLPDFSCYNLPKRGTYTKLPLNVPRSRKILPDGPKICQHLPSQDPPKFTQIGIFSFENKPSGNPGYQ
jgi:hypothetical protein